jgi:hypothetical protein
MIKLLHSRLLYNRIKHTERTTPCSSITEEQGGKIAKLISKELGIPPITVWFTNKISKPEETFWDIIYRFLFGRYFRTVGTAYLKSRTILIHKGGENLPTLIHEIAHLLPGGMNHNHQWVANYNIVKNIILDCEACLFE